MLMMILHPVHFHKPVELNWTKYTNINLGGPILIEVNRIKENNSDCIVIKKNRKCTKKSGAQEKEENVKKYIE